jgi:hypothetical protein
VLLEVLEELFGAVELLVVVDVAAPAIAEPPTASAASAATVKSSFLRWLDI